MFVHLRDLIALIMSICCYHRLDFLLNDLCVEKIMRQAFRSLIIVFAALAIVACSDDSGSDSTSTIEIEGWVGAQGLSNAQVVANQIAESGQVNVDTNGIYIGDRESSDVRSRFIANITEGKSNLLIARGQIANVDEDKDNLATQRLCQVKAGCIVAGAEYGYNVLYPVTSGFEWRSIIFNASEGSRNNINAITTMADALAYRYDVKSIGDADLDSLINEVYTAYDIVLANSQLSQLLGLEDVVGDLPANLPRMDFLTASYAGTSNQIRYAALIAGLQKLELEYQAVSVLNAPSFMEKVAGEFADDEGQMYYRTEAETRELTLVELYQAAHDNLLAIVPDVTSSEIKALANQVVADLAGNIETANAQPVDTKTTAQADDLTKLLTESEISSINLGLEKTKLFVTSLIDYQNTFWESGYKEELDAYQAMLKTIGDTHKDNLNALVAEFAHIQDYYVTCIIGGARCQEDFSDLLPRTYGYDPVTKVLLMDTGALTVSQALANLSITDSTAAVSQSNAVDVLITGTLKKGDLVLKVGHTFNDIEETDINVPSSMRIYYPEAVTEVSPNLVIEGYEIIWGDFQFYDEAAVGSATETDLSGSFRIFYRGVRDPQVLDPNGSELRFNIENWVLSSSITDSILEGADDADLTTLVITAQASNPALFYPSSRFASFDGFFVPNNSRAVGDIETGLLSYSMGEEIVNFQAGSTVVETIDFINDLGQDIRYRFFPDMWVEDELDSNGNGDTEDFVDMHLVEECVLKKGTQDVVSCGSKSRIFAKRDMQKTINDLWEFGVFQRTEVDGHGIYYVDFKTVTDAATGCLVLDTLENGLGAMDGTLLEQQVLGLNSVNMLTQILLQDEELVALPKTLFDMTVLAPTKDKYKVNAVLSHNYTDVPTPENEDDDIIGTGTNVNRVSISYDTSADFENSGNFSVFQGGVQLTLEDGSQISENQGMTAFFSQTFSDDVHYKMIENEQGVAERCVLSVGSNYDKDPVSNPLEDQVFYLNYRNVVYGTIRPEGDDDIWVIRYIDGTFSVLGKLF
jgi:hypothetical protein